MKKYQPHMGKIFYFVKIRSSELRTQNSELRHSFIKSKACDEK